MIPEGMVRAFAAYDARPGRTGGELNDSRPLRGQARNKLLVLAMLVATVLPGASAYAGNGRWQWQGKPMPALNEEDITEVTRPPARYHNGWSTAGLREHGIDPAPVAELVKRIRRGDYLGIDGVVLVHRGVLVAEAYFGGIARDDLHQTRSTFKSVTGLLVGIAISDGLLGLDDPVAPLIARYHRPADSSLRKQLITVRNLLQMQSGYDCSEMPGETPYREDKSNRSADKVAADFDLPVTAEPGTVWRYCSGNTFLLGVALESALLAWGYGPLKQYLEDRLMTPLNINHYAIGRTAKGHLPMHGGERLRPRDLAKFGQLLLSEGRWRGKQVVPEAWIAEILKPGVSTGWSWTGSLSSAPQTQRSSTYRFKWFQTLLQVKGTDYRLIHSWGNGGQFIFAVPELDLVVVVTGSNYGDRMIEEQKQAFHMLQTFLLPSVIKPAQ